VKKEQSTLRHAAEQSPIFLNTRLVSSRQSKDLVGYKKAVWKNLATNVMFSDTKPDVSLFKQGPENAYFMIV